jgi:hypothetical protein
MNIELTPHELCGAIQALRATICQRVNWMLSPQHPIRGEDFGDQNDALHDMVNAYGALMLSARRSPEIAEEFREYFNLSQALYEMIDTLYWASSWDDVPTHQHKSILSCELCEELVTAV